MVTTKVTTTAIIDIARTKAILHERILIGVNETAESAWELAERLVPVRKVFRYGRSRENLRIRGRQEVTTQSLEDALGESLLRRRLGLPSAFPTDAAGRRIPGTQSLVRTAQFLNGERTFNRANRDRGLGSINDRRQVRKIGGENRLAVEEDIFDDRDRLIGQRFRIDYEAESDLSGRGRAELRRAQPGGTLGGALKKSLKLQRASDGRQITARIVVGNEEIDYAKYVEFGTRRSRAQPFMRPAKAQAREEFLPNLKTALSGQVFKTRR